MSEFLLSWSFPLGLAFLLSILGLGLRALLRSEARELKRRQEAATYDQDAIMGAAYNIAWGLQRIIFRTDDARYSEEGAQMLNDGLRVALRLLSERHE